MGVERKHHMQLLREFLGGGDDAAVDTIAASIQDGTLRADLASGGASNAAQLVYSPTNTALTADNVQQAIDELDTNVSAITAGAATVAQNVGYDNNLSALVSTNVKTALDELDSAKTTEAYVTANAAPALINTDGDLGRQIYVGTIDPSVGHALVAGDVWLEPTV